MLFPANAFQLPLAVAESDIDLQGHVSNVTIVKWMSRAAWQHSLSLGYDIQAYQQLGAWFVIRRHEIDYLAPALLGDRLILYTWPSSLTKVTAGRKHLLVRVADQTPIARGYNLWAYIDAQTGQPRRIPSEVRQAFDPAKFAI